MKVLYFWTSLALYINLVVYPSNFVRLKVKVRQLLVCRLCNDICNMCQKTIMPAFETRFLMQYNRVKFRTRTVQQIQSLFCIKILVLNAVLKIYDIKIRI